MNKDFGESLLWTDLWSIERWHSLWISRGWKLVNQMDISLFELKKARKAVKFLANIRRIKTFTFWTRELKILALANREGDLITPTILQFSHSVVWLFMTPWTAEWQASLSITNSWSLLKLMSIKSVMASNHLILCHLLLLLNSIFPSIRVFSNESVLRTRWPKYWSYSFSISPSKEYSRLISFRMDWFHLLAVQRTLESLLQHHGSKASILHAQLSL